MLHATVIHRSDVRRTYFLTLSLAVGSTSACVFSWRMSSDPSIGNSGRWLLASTVCAALAYMLTREATRAWQTLRTISVDDASSPAASPEPLLSSVHRGLATVQRVLTGLTKLIVISPAYLMLASGLGWIAWYLTDVRELYTFANFFAACFAVGAASALWQAITSIKIGAGMLSQAAGGFRPGKQRTADPSALLNSRILRR